MSFSSPCVKSNEALQKRNTSMSIDIGPTNHLDTEENWKQEQWYNCVLLSPPFKMCFYVNKLPFFFFCNGIMGLKLADLWYAPNKVNIVLVFWGVDRSNLSDLSGDLINPVACFTCQRSSHCCHSKAGIREHVLLLQLLPCKVQNLKALKPIIQANSCLIYLLEPTCLSLPFGWLLYKA